MDRLKAVYARLVGTDIATLAFIALSIKACAINIDYPEAMALACASAVYAYKAHLKSKRPDPIRINQEVKTELDNLKGAVNALKLEKTIPAGKPKYF